MSTPSPLSVPPAKTPWDEADFRFKTNSTACEWGEAYHPGGYHPVHLGDTIRHRFRVLRKLGYGVFSTVWLAVDLQCASPRPSPFCERVLALRLKLKLKLTV